MSARREARATFREDVTAGVASYELLEVVGPDRERLLHGLVTCDVRGLAPGATVHGFFTHGKGGILADFRLLAGEESFRLLLPSGVAERISMHLDKYKLAADVAILPRPGVPVLEVRGAGAESDLVKAADAASVSIFRDPVAKASRFFLLPEASGPAPEPEAWVRNTTEALRLRRVQEEELELARIEDGELRFGIDFGADNFPQETGRDEAVSYTKGCYLGQEIVARIHYRGGVQRLPVGLRFGAEEPPAAGVELVLDGRAVGRATSVARSPRCGAIGLGIVHRRGSEVGTKFEVHGDGVAEVVSLPFSSQGGGR